MRRGPSQDPDGFCLGSPESARPSIQVSARAAFPESRIAQVSPGLVSGSSHGQSPKSARAALSSKPLATESLAPVSTFIEDGLVSGRLSRSGP